MHHQGHQLPIAGELSELAIQTSPSTNLDEWLPGRFGLRGGLVIWWVGGLVGWWVGGLEGGLVGWWVGGSLTPWESRKRDESCSQLGSPF